MIQKNFPLNNISRYKIGGNARYFLDIKKVDDLKTGLGKMRSILTQNNTGSDKFFVIGGATNILFSDRGYRGLIIRNSINYIKPLTSGLIEVGAGTPVDTINKYCLANSLTGTEWAGGLPGTLGGAIFGNAGAFGGETKDIIASITSMDIRTGKIISRKNKDCLFGYRTSIFKQNDLSEFIINATLKIGSGNKKEIGQALERHIAYREKKQPLDLPNLGSTFKNVAVADFPERKMALVQTKIKNDPFPVIPAAYLIHLLNLAGRRRGQAEISTKHPNFIINKGNAKSRDVKKLIWLVQRKAKDNFGVKLQTEIIRLNY